MVQYLKNALKYNRVSEWKSGSEKLRMFFDATPEVQSRKRADEVDCDDKTKTWQEDMKDKLGSWW